VRRISTGSHLATGLKLEEGEPDHLEHTVKLAAARTLIAVEHGHRSVLR